MKKVYLNEDNTKVSTSTNDITNKVFDEEKTTITKNDINIKINDNNNDDDDEEKKVEDNQNPIKQLNIIHTKCNIFGLYNKIKHVYQWLLCLYWPFHLVGGIFCSKTYSKKI